MSSVIRCERSMKVYTSNTHSNVKVFLQATPSTSYEVLDTLFLTNVSRTGPSLKQKLKHMSNIPA